MRSRFHKVCVCFQSVSEKSERKLSGIFSENWENEVMPKQILILKILGQRSFFVFVRRTFLEY